MQRTTDQAPTNITSQIYPTIMLPGQSATSLPKPALPPIPSWIKEKIAKGEYIDFTTIVPKSMFGPLEPQSQSLTLQYDQTENNFSVQLATPTRRITLFSAWMEAWNVYLAV